ncbi:hypothetical protein AA106555_1109 [Neokomagataea thailandica NBRC 106555]|uniref:Glucosamine inositolphosphorylceramide transferase 1 N-terminal domain-containing protein n=2 Tax=Neokomagataea TaxID=1223423 RepID=A0A4Y6V5W9_9PROT|nr:MULTISPECIES: hypothetical protein [Neokomagataea]QDH24258.1 hypothetical protein D5366_02160 [Neokomagataea tanensis]GBR52976.1 hypothetical protein AA106555_1109 [Neokomagataea thailandica NBRC 106555]
MPFFRTDHWRSAILHEPLTELLEQKNWDGVSVTLLPDEGDHRFLADPFGMWHGDLLYVFAEAFDYRSAKGVIDVLIYDQQFVLQRRHQALEKPWHLSYPFVFKHEGVFYMLPEASGSGRLTLYRATNFPLGWESVPEFDFPAAAVDATPFFMHGQWWLFWNPPGTKEERQSVLALSTAPSLYGPWTDRGIIHRDRAGARPGGTPCVTRSGVVLPVQDCRGTYGKNIRLLHIDGLERGEVRVTPQEHLNIPSTLKHAYPDGMHTLSASGDVTLVDVKRIGYGPRRDLMNFRRRFLKR